MWLMSPSDTREVLRDSGDPDVPTMMGADPFLGILPTDRFESLASDVAITTERLIGRTTLLYEVDAGRDHWSRAYYAVFAGGGFAKGRVVGRTDRIAGEEAETPFSPKDVIATMFNVLGIDPQTEIPVR